MSNTEPTALYYAYETTILKEQLEEARNTLFNLQNQKNLLSGDENKSARRKIRKEIADTEEMIKTLEAKLKDAPAPKFSATWLRDQILKSLKQESELYTATKEKFLAEVQENPAYAISSYADSMVIAQTHNEIADCILKTYENAEYTEAGEMGSLKRLMTICYTVYNQCRDDILSTTNRLHSRSTSALANLVEDLEISAKSRLISNYSFYWTSHFRLAERYLNEDRVVFDENLTN